MHCDLCVVGGHFFDAWEIRCMGAHSRVSSLCIVSRKTFWTNWHKPVCDSIKECYLCVLLLARGGNGRFPCSVQAIARTMTVYRGTIFVSRMSSNMWMYDLILWWLAWTWNSKYRGSTMAWILYLYVAGVRTKRCHSILKCYIVIPTCHTNIVIPFCRGSLYSGRFPPQTSLREQKQRGYQDLSAGWEIHGWITLDFGPVLEISLSTKVHWTLQP